MLVEHRRFPNRSRDDVSAAIFCQGGDGFEFRVDIFMSYHANLVCDNVTELCLETVYSVVEREDGRNNHEQRFHCPIA